MDHLRKLSAALGLVCLWSHAAHAIGPTYASDGDLAKYPIIVVAQWEKSPFKSHNQYDNDKILINEEITTRLNVRIRIEYPGTGRGTAICNSGHPTNKGAGKRPK
jgi:hypothetical protein